MNMEQRGGRGGEMSRSSTADLSSPPSEPERPQSFPSPSQQLSNHHHYYEAPHSADSTIIVDDGGGENYSTNPPATTTVRHTSNPQPQPQQTQQQPQSASTTQRSKDEKPKIRRPRKKAAAAAAAADSEKDKEKEQKDKAARKPRTASGAGGPVRKKAKLDNPLAHNHCSAPLPVASTTATSTLVSANAADYPIRTHDTPTLDAYSANPHQPQTPQPTSPAPVSRLSYDPVRSMMVERNPASKVYSTAPPGTGTGTNTITPSKPVTLRTAASPTTISHLIIEPLPQASFQAKSLQAQTKSHESVQEGSILEDAGASITEIDFLQVKPANQAKKTSSGTPSNAPSPKPGRAKEQPPALPQGSGLLSSALFGNATAEATAGATSSGHAPNIVVHVKLKSNDNNIINFAQLAEQKYGFAALHPRLAAQKERLARVAAAGAALERSANGSRMGGTSAGESGDDDLSVDIDRESENDGDVAMTGVNGCGGAGGGGGTGANSGTDATGNKKRRRKKMEEYDQDDPFVDDSELAWEAQAAAVKDGFFVYCGPLVPEGEKPAVERADGTVKRGRGRGRGGGPGSRGGRAGATTTAAAAAANGESSNGRVVGAATAATGAAAAAAAAVGSGSRGGTTTRKPRVTKASRAMMEKEKQEREKMAPLAAKPSNYPTPG